MNNTFNGLGMGLATLSRLSNAQTRSISAENFSGGKGQGGRATEGTGAEAGRELGQGWKISPSINIDGSGTGKRVVAIYQNTPELQAALDRYFDTDNCCRVFHNRCRDLLFAFRDALREGSTDRLDLTPIRSSTGGPQR